MRFTDQQVPKSVHVISKSAWREAVKSDHALETAIGEWHKVARSAAWTSLVDVKKVYPHADFVDPLTVFNIKGNAYRLIVKIEYRWQIIFVKHLLRHREYDKGDWKKKQHLGSLDPE
jgi:mRNA interferase HigB